VGCFSRVKTKIPLETESISLAAALACRQAVEVSEVLAAPAKSAIALVWAAAIKWDNIFSKGL
jgi:hypothetical protein